ncbi:MAG: hypothetical protein ACE5HL_01655 [Terriglobia bacterium]
MRRHILLGVVLSLLFAPALALGQQETQPITWIGFFKAQPGKGEDFVGLIMEYDKPVLDKLLADGTIMAWGIDAPWTHGDDTWTHSLWATMANWGQLGRLEKAFEEAQKARSKEENEKLEQKFRATIVAGSHRDLILRELVFALKPSGAEGNPAKPYTRVALYKVKPGKGEQALKLYKKVAQPVYEQLLAEGTIIGYGLNVQAVHSNPEVTHAGWIVANDLSALDRIREAFQEADKKRSKEEQAWLESQFRELFVSGAHRDFILRAAHFASR